ncbi:MAG: Ig-like domain-containing protein, partial [Terriglobales bacterium]
MRSLLLVVSALAFGYLGGGVGSCGGCNDNCFQNTNLVIGVQVTPSNPTISIGGSQQFTATDTFFDGRQENRTGSASWSSSNTSVATIQSSGLAQELAAGASTIQAQFGGQSGMTSLTVVAAPSPTVKVTGGPQNLAVALPNSPHTFAYILDEGRDRVAHFLVLEPGTRLEATG